MELIGAYTNGNYQIKLFDDGTKIRETFNENEQFNAEFPECIDLKITNQCDMGCKYCHENSTTNGKHGDINADFINSLKPYTELALGGGNVLSHPQLIPLLQKLKKQYIISNITLNQYHFMNNLDIIDILIKEKLIHGLGISLIKVNDELIKTLKKYPNIVIHVINGIVKIDDLKKLSNHGFKLLILGYKEFRRGKNFYSSIIENNKQIIYDNLATIIKQFDVVSFDNLAIKQLEVKRFLSNKSWNEFYMGNDGQFTMYIDLPNKKFAKNSIAEKRYDLLNDINDMFEIIKNEN